ncbi:post-transcriptional regulator [Bacillus solimangrovi]|uniref:Uncharacterized protein n=1 Tax=Bacillus solimangrovi TaxID=1305675 RepID=A0A1E5LBP1_9BACI|nr:post-transcriptional regulator [Bacillus solimangrovi]OEH91493.1 hypothetical protein BFG57_05095 [Bacillus solimangrovi]
MSIDLFNPHEVDTYYHQVEPALRSKVEELHHHGYTKATEEEIWKCLKKKRWKKIDQIRLYQMVSDIMTLTVHEYMSFITQENYKNNDWFAEFEENRQQ